MTQLYMGRSASEEQNRRTNEILNGRMCCPFELSAAPRHELVFIGARFGRFVTEWVRCDTCERIFEVQRGVIGPAVLLDGKVLARMDPIDEKNWKRRQARAVRRRRRERKRAHA